MEADLSLRPLLLFLLLLRLPLFLEDDNDESCLATHEGQQTTLGRFLLGPLKMPRNPGLFLLASLNSDEAVVKDRDEGEGEAPRRLWPPFFGGSGGGSSS